MCVLVTTGLCSSADLDSTAEMLKQLQDSGVLNNVKAELEKMMKDPSQRATLQDAIMAREKELRAKINEQLNEIDDEDAKSGDEMMTFVVSYVKEKSLSLQKDVMKHISAIPIEGGDSQKPMHFVQLSSLLDQLAQADKATQKSVLATNFKTLSELKEHLAKKPKNSAPPPPATVKEEKAPTTKPTGDSQVANAIRGFATMAGNNPEMMVNMILMGMSNYQLGPGDDHNDAWLLQGPGQDGRVHRIRPIRCRDACHHGGVGGGRRVDQNHASLHAGRHKGQRL